MTRTSPAANRVYCCRRAVRRALAADPPNAALIHRRRLALLRASWRRWQERNAR